MSAKRANSARKRDAYILLRQCIAGDRAIYVVVRNVSAASVMDLTFLATDMAADLTEAIAALLGQPTRLNRCAVRPVSRMRSDMIDGTLAAINLELFGEGTEHTVRFIWV